MLAFVARRLEPDPIILLIATREGCENAFVDTGLPEMHLQGLDVPSAGAREPTLRTPVAGSAPSYEQSLLPISMLLG